MKKANFFVFVSAIVLIFLCMVTSAITSQPIFVIVMGAGFVVMIIAGATGIYCSDSEDYCKVKRN